MIVLIRARPTERIKTIKYIGSQSLLICSKVNLVPSSVLVVKVKYTKSKRGTNIKINIQTIYG